MVTHLKYPNEAGIYKLTCINNEKVYIGKSVDINKRIGDHRRSCNRVKGRFYFENALISHGWDAFEVEVLEIFENFDKLRDNEALLDIETSYIDLFDSRNPDKGYNICKRGTDRTGYKCSEETKEKISRGNLGKTVSEEVKEKLRQANLGKCSPMLGKLHSEEAKEKIRHAKLGRKHSEETKEKISRGHLGKIRSSEHAEKLRQANLGKARSNEFKEECRQRQLGKKHSDEHKEKIRNSIKGLVRGPMTAEHKEKIRQTKEKNKIYEHRNQGLE